MSWADWSDRVLAQLFAPGKPAPTKKEIRDAYPFGERRYWPYKAWCRRVKAWKAAHAMGMCAPLVVAGAVAKRRKTEQSDTDTLPLF